jgi:hypothetical protein
MKKESAMKPFKTTPHSLYSKEMQKFIERIKKLAQKGKLSYEQDPFWSSAPQKLGRTNSSKLDALLYRKS